MGQVLAGAVETFVSAPSELISLQLLLLFVVALEEELEEADEEDEDVEMGELLHELDDVLGELLLNWGDRFC